MTVGVVGISNPCIASCQSCKWVSGADYGNVFSVPNDKETAQKLAECEKLVKRINFEKAIEVDDPPSPSAGLELDKMGESSCSSG